MPTGFYKAFAAKLKTTSRMCQSQKGNGCFRSVFCSDFEISRLEENDQSRRSSVTQGGSYVLEPGRKLVHKRFQRRVSNSAIHF